MHGEYKVPGGKLVVDFEAADGAISGFRLAGDFFLEPDTALEDINAAVRSLPEGAQLLGFTPDVVGTAVRLSLFTAPGWRDFDWEIVHEDAVSPRMNLALDEVFTTRVGAAGLRRPTLRIWEWDESAVVIGSFQSYRNEVDPEGAPRHGFDVVRRIPGARRDDDGRGTDHHLLALRLGRACAGHDVRRLLRLPRRLGASGAPFPGHRRGLPAAERHRRALRQDRWRGSEAPGERGRAAPRDAPTTSTARR